MMKYCTLILIYLASLKATAQPRFELSANVYRLPYANGTSMKVNRDHFTHTSPDGDVTGRYDLVGTGQGSGCSIYRIVSAAAGIVRRVVDNHSASCESCADDNNYVWIEHANNEWTKYTHLKRFSASVDAGLVVGDTVCAGTFLGYECDIGAASGKHLHFEVRRPNDPANISISVNGGFMDRADAAHLVPVINTITKHFMQDDDSWVSAGSGVCTGTVTVPDLTLNNDGYRVYMATSAINTNNNAVVLHNGASAVFHSGGSITFTPGFVAEAGSYFNAKIGNCSTTAFPGGCN